MKGFTLIELLIVMALIILLSSLTIPLLVDHNALLLEHELEKLELVIDYLNQQALATNQSQTLFFDLQTNSFFYSKNNKKIIQTLPSALQFGFLAAFGPPGAPTHPITQAITLPAQNGLFRLELLSNGKMTPGTIYIVDKQKKGMGALTCTVSQVSYIRRYVYKANQWTLLAS